MVTSRETTPAAYLASLAPEQRRIIEGVRAVVKQRLPEGYVETMSSGMLSYEIPLARYPDTYNGKPFMYMALAAQKNNCALYMMNVYGEPALRRRLEAAFAAAGKKLDMGKSCLRFKSLDALPLDAIGDIVASTPVERMIEVAESARRGRS